MIDYDYLLKFILIGDSGVGKTTLMSAFCNDNKKCIEPTIGVEFGAKQMKVGSKSVKLQIWDSAGSEQFRSITRGYYRNTVGTIIVYDVSNYQSFLNVKYWLKEIAEYGKEHNKVTLIGNKTDLKELRRVPYEVGSDFAKENDYLFFETSALNRQGLNEPFVKSVECALKSIEEGKIDIFDESSGVKIGNFSSASPYKRQTNNKCCN